MAPPPTRGLIIGLVCVLVFLAAILSNQRATRPPSSAVEALQTTRGEDQDPWSVSANTDETASQHKGGPEKENVPHRTEKELEEAIAKDEETFMIIRGKGEGEKGEEEQENVPDDLNDGEEEPEKTSEEKEAAEMSAKEEAANPNRRQPFTLNYEVKDEDCKTSRKLDRIGLQGGPRLQYIHLPKTGGTSIQLQMAGWALHSSKRTVLLKFDRNAVRGSSFICPFGTTEATILVGHRGFGYCADAEHAPRGLFTFATFRRSASRIISLFDYNYNREEMRTMRIFGSTPLGTWIKRYNATTDVAEEGERLLKSAGSQQARFMCGYECLGPNVMHNKTITLAYIMRRAKENLDKLDMIGLTEELNECIEQVRFHLTLQRPNFRHWPEANEMAKFRKTELDPEALAILEEWAKPDQELYDYARVLYLKKQAIAKECRKRGLVPATPAKQT